MATDRKILLIVLGVVILICFGLLFSEKITAVFPSLDSSPEIEASRQQFDEFALKSRNLAELRSLEAAGKALLENEEARFYHQGEIDDYTLGSEILFLLKEKGVELIRYRPMESEDLTMEWVVRGPTFNVMNLVRAVESSEKYRSLSSFNFKESEPGVLEGEFQIVCLFQD